MQLLGTEKTNPKGAETYNKSTEKNFKFSRITFSRTSMSDNSAKFRLNALFTSYLSFSCGPEAARFQIRGRPDFKVCGRSLKER